MFQSSAKYEFVASCEADMTSKYLAIVRTYPDTWWYKLPDIGRKTKPVDILGNVSGRFVACELKYFTTVPKDLRVAIHKHLELHQIATLEQTKRAGGLALVGGYIKPFNSLYVFEWGTTLPNWSELSKT